MERDFVQAQADLARSNANKQKMQQEQRKLNQRLRRMKDGMDEIQDDLEHEQSGRLLMKRKFKELEATAEIQEARSEKLQDELDSAQTLLVDSTSAAADSRHALDDCKQASDRMYVVLINICIFFVEDENRSSSLPDSFHFLLLYF